MAGERVLRSEHRLPDAPALLMAATRKRKPLTAEELAERRRKVGGCVVMVDLNELYVLFVA